MPRATDAPLSQDASFMRLALAEAEAAAAGGEVPVGAVVVRQGEVLARAGNAPIAQHDPSGHAEILALRRAGAAIGNYRLPGCTLYVTLEPCAMCAGAILHARLERLVFGAYDPAAGAVVSRFTLLSQPAHAAPPVWQGGMLREECGALLQAFFAGRRG